MIAETYAYKLLSNDAELSKLLDSFRGAPFGNGFKQGIFTYDIPEKPTDLKKANLAPFMRINGTFEGPQNYADDGVICIEKRIVINFWCKTASQSEKIVERLDQVLIGGGFEWYTANENPRYKDSDIDLLMNVRKYRYFDFKE
ncbi:hypothetical protein ACEF00_03855 [Streptococcus hyovaginalis]